MFVLWCWSIIIFWCENYPSLSKCTEDIFKCCILCKGLYNKEIILWRMVLKRFLYSYEPVPIYRVIFKPLLIIPHWYCFFEECQILSPTLEICNIQGHERRGAELERALDPVPRISTLCCPSWCSVCKVRRAC